MSNIIQLPRQRPGRKWSPAEILAIKEPLDTREIARQERSRIATTHKIASETGRRDRKRAKRKKAIADILDDGQQWTVSALMRLVGEQTGQSVSRTTVTELLKELKDEGQCGNTNRFWWKTTDDK
jgi:transposase